MMLGTALVNRLSSANTSPDVPPREASPRKLHDVAREASHSREGTREDEFLQGEDLQVIALRHKEQIEEYKRAIESLILDRFYALEINLQRMEGMLQEALAPSKKLPQSHSTRPPHHAPVLPPEMLAHLGKLQKATEDLRTVDERCRLTEQLFVEGIRSVEATLEREISKQCELITNAEYQLQQPWDGHSEERSVVDRIPRFETQSLSLRSTAATDKDCGVRFADSKRSELDLAASDLPTESTGYSKAGSDLSGLVKLQECSRHFVQATDFTRRAGAKTKTKELFKHHNAMPKNNAQDVLQQLVHSHLFIGFIEFCIIANVGIKVVQMDVDMKRALRNEQSAQWGYHVDFLFTAIFLLELLARIAADRHWFFVGREKVWNLFDLFVVTCSIVEMLTDGLGLSFLRIFRSLRLVRALKIVRVFRFFRELRLMAVSIASCMVSLFWALIMIFLVILVFAMFVMEGSKHYLLDDKATDSIRRDIGSMYGSFPEAAYSLVQSISGGGDWGNFAAPLLEVSWMYGAGFALFVCFVTLGMMNILIGIFVENAQQYSKLDRDLVIQKEMDQRRSYMNQLRELFHEIDQDNNGTMSYHGFNECLSAERAQAYLDFLQLNASEAQGLFMLLDLDENGVISVEDFVLGCMRLKGHAKSVDAAAMMYQTKRLAIKVNELSVYIQERLELLVSLAQKPK